MLRSLQEWFMLNCNGEWEHEYGIKIETVDNPGWHVEIDLAGTPLEKQQYESRQLERTDDNWFSCRVENDKFIAGCGARNLEEVIGEFRKWASSIMDWKRSIQG